MARIFLVFTGVLFTLKACWHRHKLSEVLNAADIAGLSDGRCTLSLEAGLAEERRVLRVKTYISVGLASVVATMTAASYHFD